MKIISKSQAMIAARVLSPRAHDLFIFAGVRVSQTLRKAALLRKFACLKGIADVYEDEKYVVVGDDDLCLTIRKLSHS